MGSKQVRRLGGVSSAVVLVLALPFLGSCDSNAGMIQGKYNPEVSGPLLGAIESESETLLSDVTPYEWETVTFFHEATQPEEMISTIGVGVLDPSYTWARFTIVFCSEGSVVEALLVTFDSLQVDQGATMSNEAVIRAGEVTDPAPQPVSPQCVAN